MKLRIKEKELMVTSVFLSCKHRNVNKCVYLYTNSYTYMGQNTTDNASVQHIISSMEHAETGGIDVSFMLVGHTKFLSRSVTSFLESILLFIGFNYG